jgi:DNA-binding CsgD family transcriptional regulator
LLEVLAGQAGERECRAIAATASGNLRWNRHFLLLAEAVLAARGGRAATAMETLAEAHEVAAPFASARHLGLRLIGESAVVDGWGTPAAWLRAAEEYFHDTDAAVVANACRALLRRAGSPAPQRRRGHQTIPAELRASGITVREFEVLQLLRGRLSNLEIAHRLQLSPRTVEKHVANLMAKTHLPNRVALAQYALTLPHG